MEEHRLDHFAVAAHLPSLREEPIRSFRRAYDPTVDLVGPHLTLVFQIGRAHV